MPTRRQLLAGAATGAAGYMASVALGKGRGWGYGTTHKLGRTTTTTGTGLRDTTAIQDDIALIYFGSSADETNKDHYKMIAQGNGSGFESQPGQCITYTTGNQTSDSLPIVDQTTARANGWLVHDNAGAEIPWGVSHFLTDPGNAGYQTECKNRIATYLSANPTVDGIFVDNFVMDAPQMGSPGAAYPIKNQSNVVIWNNASDFQTAQLSFSANVHAYVKNTLGKQVVVNAGGAVAGDNNSSNGILTRQWMDGYHTYVTGMMVEYWEQWDQGHVPPREVFWNDAALGTPATYRWDGSLATIAYCNTLGLDPYPLSYAQPSELTQQAYARASFLMEWNGSKGALMVSPWTGGTDVWNSALAKDVGQPQSAKQAVGSGCWKRVYEHYTIYVNPSGTNQTLDGHTVNTSEALFV